MMRRFNRTMLVFFSQRSSQFSHWMLLLSVLLRWMMIRVTCLIDGVLTGQRSMFCRNTHIHSPVHVFCKCKEFFIKIPLVTVTLINYTFEVHQVFDYSFISPHNCFMKWKYAHDLELLACPEPVRCVLCTEKSVWWNDRSSTWPIFSCPLLEAAHVKVMWSPLGPWFRSTRFLFSRRLAL